MFTNNETEVVRNKIKGLFHVEPYELCREIDSVMKELVGE
jgi:hypothetical protein